MVLELQATSRCARPTHVWVCMLCVKAEQGRGCGSSMPRAQVTLCAHTPSAARASSGLQPVAWGACMLSSHASDSQECACIQV